MRLRALVLFAALPPLLYAAAARTQSADIGAEQERIRCATRLSMALLRQSPSPELLAATDPQAEIDALLADDAFVINFARFINSRFNIDPGEAPAEDATFFLARHILREGKPWRDLFDGPYQVEAFLNANGQPRARVIDDPDGLGFFRSPTWMRRYAGNEEDGYRLVAAFRIQQNIIGLDVSAINTAPDQDISAEGRKSPACSGCHYDSYFALDKVAKILSRRVGEDEDIVFVEPDEGPQEILGGQTIANDAELVGALLDSTDFQFQTCRLTFEFLYGRPENDCEAPLFDACVDAFAASGDVRDAIRTVATDPGFCD
jgi:hypothetical protein